MVTAASGRSASGRCARSLDTLLAPNTLWMAAKCAAPCSWQKWGAKTHPRTHLRRRNLHAPHGDPGAPPPPLPEDAMAAAVNA